MHSLTQPLTTTSPPPPPLSLLPLPRPQDRLNQELVVDMMKEQMLKKKGTDAGSHTHAAGEGEEHKEEDEIFKKAGVSAEWIELSHKEEQLVHDMTGTALLFTFLVI
jgi:hypothetical protein